MSDGSKRFEKEWIKKVDISTLFRLEKATGHLKKLAEDESLGGPLRNKFLTEVEELEVCLAVAQGKVTIEKAKAIANDFNTSLTATVLKCSENYI